MDTTIHFAADVVARHRVELLVEHERWTTCKCIEEVDERGEASGITASS